MLTEQKVEITRVPVNRVVDKAPAVRTENDTTIIPVLEEVLVVQGIGCDHECVDLLRRQTGKSRIDIQSNTYSPAYM